MVGQCLDNGKKWERTAAHNLSTVLLAGQDVCEELRTQYRWELWLFTCSTQCVLVKGEVKGAELIKLGLKHG